jgi:hypothetical protein
MESMPVVVLEVVVVSIFVAVKSGFATDCGLSRGEIVS